MKKIVLILSLLLFVVSGCKKNTNSAPDKEKFALPVWAWDAGGPMNLNNAPLPAIDDNNNSYYFIQFYNEPAVTLFSLNDEGKIRWKCPTAFYPGYSCSNSVILNNGNLYFYNQQIVFCYKRSDGTQVWKYQLNDRESIQDIVVKNGEVWITYNDMANIELAKLDAGGKLLWHKPCKNYLFETGIAAYGNKLYILLYDVFDNRTDLVAVNIDSGNQLWKFVPDTNIAGEDLSVDGNGNVYYSTYEGILLSVDGNSGSLRWQYNPENEKSNRYLASGGVTILPDNDVVFAAGPLICFDENGNEKWRSSVDSRLSFTLGNNNILYGWGATLDVKLFAIDAATGEKLSIKFSTLDDDLKAGVFPPAITHTGKLIMAGVSKIHCITSMSTSLEENGWSKPGKGYENNSVR